MTAKEWLKAYEEQRNTRALDTMTIKAAELIKEMESLETQIICIQNDNAKYCEMLAKIEIEVKKLREKIKDKEKETEFLKGQIEAYQYCMNCRR